MIQGKARIRLPGVFALLILALPARAADWLPVPPEDLALKRDPKAPTAPAIVLYRQVDRDDEASYESVYRRIKILTEEGRKHADVEIPYVKGSESIRGLEIRTIRPDGTIVDFEGTVYDKELVKVRRSKMMAKSFALPNVEVGSIIEYRYRRQLPAYWVFDSKWVLSDDLFTRHAVFSLRPNRTYALRWAWPFGLPDGTEVPKHERGVIRLVTRDVPAFVTEEHMPPEDIMKYRVEFIYEDQDSDQKDPDQYWKAFAKRRHKSVADFMGRNRAALEKAVAGIVQPEDSAETKARKVYARVQQIRNLSYERRMTEQEAKREDLDDIRDAEDIWRLGYGNAYQITWLFVALLRAADIQADPVLVSTRDDFFFSKRLANSRQLDSNAVLVRLDDREIFLDPATPFTPFGLLPWSETGVHGLRLDAEGGKWVETPHVKATDSRVERKGTFKLTTRGSLEGKVTVTYTGLEALWRRLSQRNEDDTNRTQFLEREIEADVPVGIDVKLTNSPDWTGSETSLVAEFDLEVPGWASGAGQRAILPVGLFGAGEKHTFEHGARVHPIYFRFAYQHTDDVAIELPSGWQVSSVPESRTAHINGAKYSMTSKANGNSLHLTRDLTSALVLLKVEAYPTVRDFFQKVRAGDEEQAVLAPGAPVTTRTAR
jgi:transglutaminase-like putative cysteine protease